MPQEIHSIMKRMPEILEDSENNLPGVMRKLLERLTENLKEIDRQVVELERQIQLWHRENEASSKLAEIPGIGPLTASAIVATVGRAKEFKSGRQLAAWMGLVPRQHHGARAVIRFAENKAKPESWLRKLMTRRNKNVAAVALANKNARIVWAILTNNQTFHPAYTSATIVAKI
jgi:transposase